MLRSARLFDISKRPSAEPAVSYAYDDSNNRKTMTINGKSVTNYTYDKSNRLLAETTKENSELNIARYNYENNGNTICKTKEKISPTIQGQPTEVSLSTGGEQETTDLTLNEYDGFNQLIKTSTGDLTAEYTYDGTGLRTSKNVNGTVTNQIWDGDQIALETDESGNIKNKYVRGINLIYGEDELANKKFYLFNAHGDVTQLTDASGNVIKNYEYDAFGNEKNSDPNDTNVFRYSGEYFDKENGTIYLRARYYDPTIGRFITEDSYTGKDADPLSLNLYTYCHNDGVNYFDPTGHKDVVTTFTGTYLQSNGQVCINVDTNKVVWGTRGNVAIKNYRILDYDGTWYLVGDSYTKISYTLKKHTFTNLNISVYETSNGKGFNWYSEEAYLNDGLGFIENGKTTKITSISGLASIDNAHKNDKAWAWTKVAIGGVSDVVTVAKVAKVVKGEKAIEGLWASAKAGWSQFWGDVRPGIDDLATGAQDVYNGQNPDYSWLTGLIPIYGTYQAIMDAKSNKPLGAFVN